MSTPNAPAVSSSAASTVAASAPNEDDLRKQLRAAMQSLNKREPLEPNYKRLLLNGIVTTRRPVLPKDKFYKRVGSRIRERVEQFLEQNQGKDPFDRISQRQPFEEDKMRAALTLREAKEHEQQALLEATLAALPRRNGMDEASRRRYLEGIALGLQSKEKKPARALTPPPSSLAQQTELAQQQAELDRQRAQARAREQARIKKEEAERKRREEELQRKKKHETPQQAIFKILWDMEFTNLGGTNPFRIVIDKDTCASMGAPDYCEIIEKPMNLTYIQQKLERNEYDTLPSFLADVELLINNALLYNSDLGNPYRIAALEMQKKYKRIVSKILAVQQKHQAKK